MWSVCEGAHLRANVINLKSAKEMKKNRRSLDEYADSQFLAVRKGFELKKSKIYVSKFNQFTIDHL